MAKIIKVQAEVIIPRVPSFLRIANAGEATIDVADIPTDALRAIGKEWTEALVEHARRRREIPDRPRSLISKDAAEVVS